MLLCQRHPPPTPFPYTTLFRSSTEIAGQEVTDLLFLARADLRGALQDLVASVDSEDFLRVASSCDAGLRTLKRTLISVESRSEEHTSELQSQSNLVCRLLLEKK